MNRFLGIPATVELTAWAGMLRFTAAGALWGARYALALRDAVWRRRNAQKCWFRRAMLVVGQVCSRTMQYFGGAAGCPSLLSLAESSLCTSSKKAARPGRLRGAIPSARQAIRAASDGVVWLVASADMQPSRNTVTELRGGISRMFNLGGATQAGRDVQNFCSFFNTWACRDSLEGQGLGGQVLRSYTFLSRWD